jgi:serine/threonine protein kinase
MTEPEKTIRSEKAEPSSESRSLPSVPPTLRDFRIVSELAKTPTSVVFKAKRAIELDAVALKVFHTDSGRERGFRKRLAECAEKTFFLEHPGLARCLGCEEAEGKILLIYEFIEGESLVKALSRGTRLTPSHAACVMRACAETLRFCVERGLTHGRLHPADVLFTKTRLGVEQVRLVGVGLGETPAVGLVLKTTGPDGGTHVWSPLIYAAPETLPPATFPSSLEARRAADLFSLGALSYQMLTGMPPFRADTPTTLHAERNALAPHAVRWPRAARGQIPENLQWLTQKLLAADSAARGDYSALLAALDKIYPPAAGIVPKISVAGSAPPNQELPQRPAAANVIRERWGVLVLILFICLSLILGSAALLRSRTEGKVTFPTADESAVSIEPSVRETSKAPPLKTADASDSEETELLRELAKLKEDFISSQPLDPEVVEKLRRIKHAAKDNPEINAITDIFTALARRIIAADKDLRSIPTPSASPTSETMEALFFEECAKARELAAQKRFGAALATLNTIAPALQRPPFAAKIQDEKNRLQLEAKAAFFDMTQEVEKAVENGDWAAAKNLLLDFKSRAGIPEWLEATEKKWAEIEKHLREADFAKTAARHAVVAEADQGKMADALPAAIEFAAGFRYAEAKETLTQLRAVIRDVEFLRLINDCFALVTDEEKFVAGKRAKMIADIKSDPQGHSPLQVGPTKGPKDDSVDFGANGLTIVSGSGGRIEPRRRTWDSIPNPGEQMVAMLRHLSNPIDAQDRLGLAVTAFHRECRAAWAGKDKEMLGLRRQTDDDLKAAADNDDKVAASVAKRKELFDRLRALLMPHPPKSKSPTSAIEPNEL